MPRHATILQIPEPCHENWAAMTPMAQGRHCTRCDKVVVDFTLLTDAEVVAWLAHHSSPVCGRMQQDQLDRPLVPAAVPAPQWRMWLAAGLALIGVRQLLPGISHAQTRTVLHTGSPISSQTTVSAPPGQTVQGQVVDTTGAPVPFVALQFKSLQVNGLSDERGYFSFQLSAAQLAQHATDTVVVMGLGYYKQSIFLDFTKPQLVADLRPVLQRAQVTLAPYTITVGMIVEKPAPERPHTFWQRLKRPFTGR